ncbi:MAG TPA: pyridoxamine 5'-phosphate oxidase family protein [Pseudonocardiaceae bacterium]|nr:pyridoxamine 5'-phosphate oxidase family protein [Pseudonocardiaceae bacterium]
MARPALSPTERSTPRRHRERAAADRAALDAILDEGLVCHLGFGTDAGPVVIPTGYGRDGDILYLHGSTGSASMTAAAGGAPVCVTVTLLDGIVYARSAFHHSANYRSAVIHGQARPITDDTEKSHGLRVLTEHLAPGQWDYTRPPNRRELAATTLIALDLTEAAVKTRNGGPVDDPDDVAAHQGWAGVLPLHRVWGQPQPADDLPAVVAVPERIRYRSVPT